jgi:hypothetical protein
MHFKFFSVTCLLGSVIALPVQLTTRDLSVIDAALRRVSDSMTRLNTAISTVPPFKDANEADYQINTILSFSKGLIEELQFGAANIRRGPTVNTIEAISLPAKVDSLGRLLQSVVSGVIKIKSRAVAAGRKPWVLEELINASAAMGSFFDAVLGKLAPLEQVLTAATKQQFLRTLDSAILEYRR